VTRKRLNVWSAPGGTRTHDLRVKSPLLYQLSYRRANLFAIETYKPK
jgi:hypothetical protein